MNESLMSPRAALIITTDDAPQCRECGCTESAEEACVDPWTGNLCSWANEQKTVCTCCALRLGTFVRLVVLRRFDEAEMVHELMIEKRMEAFPDEFAPDQVQIFGTAGDQLGGVW